LNGLASGNCRWQEKTEALLGFDVELAVAPGLGKNHANSGCHFRNGRASFTDVASKAFPLVTSDNGSFAAFTVGGFRIVQTLGMLRGLRFLEGVPFNIPFLRSDRHYVLHTAWGGRVADRSNGPIVSRLDKLFIQSRPVNTVL
jgi:hypothetical protein